MFLIFHEHKYFSLVNLLVYTVNKAEVLNVEFNVFVVKYRKVVRL